MALSMCGVVTFVSLLALANPVAAKSPTNTKGLASKGTGSCKKSATTVRTFCSGSLKVTVTVGNASFRFKGGLCEVSGGFFTVNSGTVVRSTYKGKKPNYVSIDMPDHPGTFQYPIHSPAGFGISGIVATLAGTEYATDTGTGDLAANKKSGTFTGTASAFGGTNMAAQPMSLSFSC
jgi:hypothetical protein